MTTLKGNIMRTKILLFILTLLSSFSVLSQGNDLELGIYQLNRGEFSICYRTISPISKRRVRPSAVSDGISVSKWLRAT